MATAYKPLGQVSPSDSSLTPLYTVPNSTQTVTSTLVVCNRGVSTNIRVAVQPSGASIDPKHYILYDNIVSAGDSLFLTLGLTLAATDVVSVFAGTDQVGFHLFGSEIA